MIILGIPYNLENYYMVDDDVAFVLQQKGIHPLYRDGNVLYFKKSSKLQKLIKKLGLEL